MQHLSLTAEIVSKGKKSTENFDPTFFSEIPYVNVNEINYLRDLEEKKKNINFPIFEFEKDFGEQAQVNDFDMLANTLYKKIMQNGYIQQKKAPSKKKKKTKNPFEYDYEDVWINDEEAVTMKKNIYAKLENFQCVSQGINQFYDSELYKSNLAQIQQQSKKRTNEISMDAQSLEIIKKKIKENISITHSRMKEEIETDKPTCIVENVHEIQNTLKLQVLNHTQNSPQNQPQNDLPQTQTDKIPPVQLQDGEPESNKPESNAKTEIKDENDQSEGKKQKKKTKSAPKTKTPKGSVKKQNNSKQRSQLLKKQNVQEIQNRNQQNGKQSEASQKSEEQGSSIQENDQKQSIEKQHESIQGGQTIIEYKQCLGIHQDNNEVGRQRMQNQVQE